MEGSALDFCLLNNSAESIAHSIQLPTLTKFILASLSASTSERLSPRAQLIQEVEEGPACILSGAPMPHIYVEF